MYKVIAAAVTAAACLTAGSATAQTPVERGKYLVESIMGCGNCHTPVGPNGPILDKALSGGPPIEEGNAFTAIPSNITPDPETGIGTWTDAEIKTAIRQGKRPPNAHDAGTLIGPPMPFGQYRGIADADIDAVVAYLRTVPAVKNVVAKSTYNIALPPAWGRRSTSRSPHRQRATSWPTAPTSRVRSAIAWNATRRWARTIASSSRRCWARAACSSTDRGG
jgi:mono/diheme cytochrome c family protein